MVEGLVRVVVLWTAAGVVRVIAGKNTSPSIDAAGAVGCIVARVVGLEVLSQAALQWAMVQSGTVLTGDHIVEATDTAMARARLVVYPVAVGAIAYVVMPFRSWWAAGAVAVALGLTNGVAFLALALYFTRAMVSGDSLREAPDKVKADTERLLGFDAPRVRMDTASTDINANADIFGNVTIMAPLIRALSHRGVMGIVGHEVGHIWHRRVVRGMGSAVIFTAASVASAVLAMRFGTPAARLMAMPDNRVTKTVAGIVLFAAVEPAMRVFVAAVQSRTYVQNEYEADAYSGMELGPGPLTEALANIGDIFGLSKRQPLAHSFPTHPHTRDRLRALQTLKGRFPDKL